MDRLRQLRKKNNKTQAQMAAVIGLTQQAYATYENNIAQPPIDILEKLADYFNVSVDYLLGRTDDKNGIALEGVYFRLESEVQELGLPPEDVQKVIDLYKKYTKME